MKAVNVKIRGTDVIHFLNIRSRSFHSENIQKEVLQ
jgi:hypothetical protein